MTQSASHETAQHPQPLRAAILGFGVVGQGIYTIIRQKAALIARQLGGRPLVVAKVLVSDAARPGRSLPDGFDAAALLTDRIEEVVGIGDKDRYDVVFEATVGEEPAFAYLLHMLTEGACRAIVTANKVMFAKHGAELLAAAAARDSVPRRPPTPAPGSAPGLNARCFVGYEACVAAGAPVVKTLQNMSLIQTITKIEGILNGTTNYVLTRMRADGVGYEAALAEAQRLGYAETNPHNDVSGLDAFSKLMIASQLSFGQQPLWADVRVTGIESITAAEVAGAAAKGLRYRHVASAELVVAPASAAAGAGEQKTSIVASVTPVLVSHTHPLYDVDGIDNILAIHTDYLGCVSVRGPGAGMFQTASVMLEDYLLSTRL